MALNDVALCSRALIRIGASPIASFADGTADPKLRALFMAPRAMHFYPLMGGALRWGRRP